jgi:hypothetical protein
MRAISSFNSSTAAWNLVAGSARAARRMRMASNTASAHSSRRTAAADMAALDVNK